MDDILGPANNHLGNELLEEVTIPSLRPPRFWLLSNRIVPYIRIVHPWTGFAARQLTRNVRWFNSSEYFKAVAPNHAQTYNDVGDPADAT